MAASDMADAGQPSPAGMADAHTAVPSAAHGASRPVAGPGAYRRYLLNDPAEMARDLIDGYVAAWPGLIRRSASGCVVRRRRKPTGRVALAIGNGVGHEPAMAGLIGYGMFDSNIPGEVFAAPPPGRIAAGVREADRGAGVLLCVSNHSGDVLNATMAVEMLAESGPSCRMVILGDDVRGASGGQSGPLPGGPGLFFVWKTVGAAAEAGYPLEACARVAEATCDRVRSLSATIGGTINPVTGLPTTEVPEGRILLGAGVHGDATGTLLDWASAAEVARLMTDRLVSELRLEQGQRCLTMVNDAGAMSVAETVVVHAEVLRQLSSRQIQIVGSWTGRYATTLATAGFAVGLCAVDDELLRLWRAPCNAPALSSHGAGPVG